MIANRVPYISRPQAEEFRTALSVSLDRPNEYPVLFYVWGTGGVGKSTLLKNFTQWAKEKEAWRNERVGIAAVSFGLTEGIDNPINLMRKLYKLLEPQFQKAKSIPFARPEPSTPFAKLEQDYFDTLHQLNTQSADGKGAASPEQINLVKKLVAQGASAAGQLAAPGSGEILKQVAEGVVDVSTAIVTEADRIRQVLQQHRATRQKRELQDLMLQPVPKLTQAFAESLGQWSKTFAIVLILDTYEKAAAEIDGWLHQTLLGNMPLQAERVRLLVAGRHNILKTEGWRKLQQDKQLVFSRSLETFDLQQTTEYLTEANLDPGATAAEVHQITRGLPYYLNWIRDQKLQGQDLNFAQGNQEIVQLLLQGLNDVQKRVIQFAACCRWFDRTLIEFLTTQHKLDFQTAVDSQRNCFDWLIQQSFVEPVQHRYRLDDVARDVFRQSLWQENEECFYQAHDLLARRFKAVSDSKVATSAAPPAKYDNPEWREARTEFLYHLLFTRRPDIQRQLINHLLEARYLKQDETVQVPLKAIDGEWSLGKHPLLQHPTRQFLIQIRPAIEQGWAVLEEDPIDYEWNALHYDFSKAETDTAIRVCLGQIEALAGLAKFAALFYKSKRCPSSEKLKWLLEAKAQAEQIATPDDPEFSSGLFLWRIGEALSALGRKEEAIGSYDKAIEYKPDKHEAWYNRGLALSDLGRKEEAIGSYDKAIEYKPDLHEAWNNRGVALSALGRKEEAIGSYDKAIEYKPDLHEAWNNRGNALSELGRKEEAIGSYDKAIEYKPDLHEAWNNRGVALYELGRKEEAIGSYDKAIEYKPDYHKAWYNRGLALYELGRKEEAIGSYDKAIEYKADFDKAWFNRGNVLKDLGQYEAAIQSFTQSLNFLPNDAWAYYNQARCYALWNNSEAAIEHLQKAIELDPEWQEKAKTNTDFDSIRADDRFRALVEGSDRGDSDGV